jgi:hypothetical protein
VLDIAGLGELFSMYSSRIEAEESASGGRT